jgi:hypothetical protein
MNNNCTGYEYTKRKFVLLLFCDRATVCMVPLSSVAFSGRRTYFNDRNYSAQLVPLIHLQYKGILTRKRAFAKKV